MAFFVAHSKLAHCVKYRVITGCWYQCSGARYERKKENISSELLTQQCFSHLVRLVVLTLLIAHVLPVENNLKRAVVLCTDG